jgi:hypothetical protein
MYLAKASLRGTEKHLDNRKANTTILYQPDCVRRDFYYSVHSGDLLYLHRQDLSQQAMFGGICARYHAHQLAVRLYAGIYNAGRDDALPFR